MKSLLKWLSQNRKYTRQVLICCAVSILSLIHGILLGWPSLAIDRLTHGEAGFHVAEDDISIIVPALSLGMFLMPILFGFILVKLGRKTNLLLNGAIYVVGWTLFTFAFSNKVLIVARFLSGLGSSVAIIIGPIYIAEIADKRIRGALISLFITVIALGEAAVTTVGIYVSYFALNVTTLVLAVLAFLSIVAFAHESPYWYLMCGREEKAEKSFRYYWDAKLGAEKSETTPASIALTEIKETVDAEMKSACSYFELVRSPSNVNATIIVVVLSFLQAATGVSSMLAYASTTLPVYDGFWKPNPTMALFNWIDLVSNIISMALIDWWGRKPLTILSNAGNALGTGIIAIYFFFKEYLHYDTSSIDWLPYIGIIIFISFYGVATATVPHILVGELFPVNVRFHASVVSVCCIAAGFAFFDYIYLHVSRIAGYSVMYLIFTLFDIAAMMFSCYYLFETKGLSLSEIQYRVLELG